jgi:hypothetical protein
LTGVSAAAVHGFDIHAPGIVEAYAPADTVLDLTRRYSLTRSVHPNVLLHAVIAPWPFEPDVRVVPPLVAALDLLDGDDERTRRAGRDYLYAGAKP